MTDVQASIQGALGTRYEVQGEVGRGGMATVFRALDRRLGRPVALKVLHPDLTHLLGADRFRREIAIAAALQHANIVSLYEAGNDGGFLYYTMPLVEGETLRSRLQRERQLPVDEAVRIAEEVAAALGCAHEHGVIHRDVKPENILLAGDRVLVADFGIARAITAAGEDRLTSAGIAIGTPAYMSPEQGAGEGALDGRSDVYALGCVLYEMLGGEPPFTGPTAQAVVARQMHEAPRSLRVVRSAVSPALQEVVERALAKVPVDRYATAGALIAALEHAKREPGKVSRPWYARPVTVGAAALAVAAAAWLVWPASVEPDPNTVMGFPLSARGGAAATTGEQVELAVGSALAGAAPLRWLSGWAYLSERQRESPGEVGVAEARRIALAHGARYYVLGAVLPAGDSQSVSLELYDARADSLVRRAPARGTAAAAVLGLRAVNALLPLLVGRSTHVDEEWLASRNPASVVSWLQGEMAYRRARYAEAMEHYRAALAEDSGLVVAAIKGAMTAAWIKEYPFGDTLVRLALLHESDLPVRNQRMARGLRFFLDGDGDSALAWFRSAVAAAPDWSEGWYGVGEAYLHLMPAGTGLDSLAEDAFDRSVRLDSSFAPAVFHLAEIQLRNGERRAAARLVRHFRAVGQDSGQRRELEVMLVCMEDGPKAVDWRSEARRYADQVVEAGRLFAAGMRRSECARPAFDAVLHLDTVDLGTRWAGAKGVFFLDLLQGDTSHAVFIADSLVGAGYKFQSLYVLGAVVGATPDAKAEAVLRPIVQPISRMNLFFLEHYGPWYVHRGDRPRVDSLVRAWRRRADSTHDAADSAPIAVLEAQRALWRGDTALAVAQLSRVRPIGSPMYLQWDFWAARAGARLLLAQLYLARGRAEEALRLAAEFDRPPQVYLAYLRQSLEVRARAAEVLGRPDVETALRTRLKGMSVPGG